MVFSNIFFLYVFLPALFLAYFVIKNNAYRRAVLIAFSLVFYAWGEPIYVFLMIGLVLADYIFGLLKRILCYYFQGMRFILRYAFCDLFRSGIVCAPRASEIIDKLSGAHASLSEAHGQPHPVFSFIHDP